jgi:NitT/TauT family transport system substrate-binding protein
MMDPGENWTRRAFVSELALAGTAGLLGLRPSPAAAEPPPETMTLRIQRPVKTLPGMCVAPQLVAHDLLRLEGFTDVQYVATDTPQRSAGLAGGAIDLSMGFVGVWIKQVDAGAPIVMLTGVHVGCYALFASERVRTIGDLRGKTIGVTELGSGRHLFLVSLLSYVGLNPNTDVTLVTKPQAESVKLFAEGQLDAYQAFSEEVQELRTRKIGHVIMTSTEERPWSQYFCCVLAANREFARAHPIATKRAVRAFLKASSLCALEPDRVASSIVDRGFTTAPYEYVRDTIKSLPYTKWREYDPADTVRFYTLRLREVGMVKSTPQKILAQGTDWRFLQELKKELKG